MKLCAIGVSGLCCVAFAMQEPPAPPAFEVASVKVVAPNDGAGFLTPTPGMLSVRNMGMMSLITWAFQLKQYQVAGPDWMAQRVGSPRFDIDAKAAGPAPVNAMRPMLRTLLEQRFHLQTHSETREANVYALTLSKGGPKRLTAAAADAKCSMQIAGKPGKGQQITFHGCPMENLAGFLPAWGLDGPVVDMTGLKGAFDFTFDMPPDDPAIEGSAEQSLQVIFPAVEEQFGIRIQKRKAPILMLVVDRVERAPTEN